MSVRVNDARLNARASRGAALRVLGCMAGTSLDGIDIACADLQLHGAGPFGLGLAGRAQQARPGSGELSLKLAAEVVLVPDDDLAGQAGGEVWVSGEDAEQHITFVGLGTSERKAGGQPVQRAQQVQPEPPEVGGVACGEAILSPARERGAARGFPGSPARPPR